MTRSSRILITTVGDLQNPATRLRPLAYLPFLRRRGHHVDVLTPRASRNGAGRRLLRLADLIRDVAAARRYDVVLVFRKTFPLGAARLLRRAARRLIYEFDDAIYLPSPSEPHDDRTRRRHRSNFDDTAAVADLIVAGNRTLGGAVGGKSVAIVPTAVDLELFRPQEATGSDACVFGWLGTAENQPQWLELVPVFRRVLRDHPHARFKVISDRPPPECGLPVEFERFTIERQAACLADVDVGLMPLEDTPWNRGKCGIKALQSMALARPVVVSPVGVNEEIVEDGVNGLVARGEEDWAAALGRLAASAELRERLGREARRTVEQRYSLVAVGERMVELIERLL